MTRNRFPCPVVTLSASSAARSYPNTMWFSVRMTNHRISSAQITYRSITKSWLVSRWQPLQTRCMESVCQNQSYNTASSILRRKSNSTVRTIKRCSVPSASSSTLSRSTKLSIVPLKVRLRNWRKFYSFFLGSFLYIRVDFWPKPVRVNLNSRKSSSCMK